MKKGKDYIIATKGLEYYEQRKAYQRQYEKDHKDERNEYKKRHHREKKLAEYTPIVDLDCEEWRKIEFADDGYFVSNYGRVKSINYNHQIGMPQLMSTKQDANGYPRVAINVNGEHKTVKVHHCVARAFPEVCGEYYEGCHIHHLNEDRSDNRVDNLRVIDSIEHSKMHKQFGRYNKSAITKKRPILAYHNEDDKFMIWFASSADAAEMLTGNRKAATSITAVIKGRQKTYKGLKYKYIE